MHIADIIAPPLAQFCATVAEQQAIAIGLACDIQYPLGRIVELASIICEAVENAADMQLRIDACATVIADIAALAKKDAENIERACGVIGAALRGSVAS